MSAWSRYCEEHINEEGRHRKFPEWEVIGVYTFQRSDGWTSAHKAEFNRCFWSTTAEESMRLADKFIPLGGDPPTGVDMRSKEDTLYTDLLRLDEAEEAKA